MKASVVFNPIDRDREIFDLTISGGNAELSETYFANFSPQRVKEDAISLVIAGAEMLSSLDEAWADDITEALNRGE